MQAAVHGGLSRKSQQTLDQFASGKTETRSPQPGMRLVREWNGSVQVVTVDDDGTIHWNDRTDFAAETGCQRGKLGLQVNTTRDWSPRIRMAKPRRPFAVLFELALRFLSNPHSL